MMIVRSLRLAGILVAAAAVAACATTGGTPTPTTDNAAQSGSPNPSAPASTGQPLPAYGAPRVPQPVAPDRLAQFIRDPCSVLTPNQVQQLGIPAGKIFNDPTLPDKSAPPCNWRTPSSITSPKMFNIVAGFALNGQGLSFFYHNKQVNPRAVSVFHYEGTVNGFPYIRYETDESQKIGGCSYDVGVSDQVALGVGTGEISGTDSCQALLEVTKSITSTLRNGG